jgi:DNA-directed RNA polymerase specialized sigma24 family protein
MATDCGEVATEHREMATEGEKVVTGRGGMVTEREKVATHRRKVVAETPLTAIALVQVSASPAVAPPKKPHPNARRLSHPEVARRIRAVIGKKVPRQDVQDVVQSVYLRLSMMLDSLPESDEELVSLAGLITHGRVVDHIRHGLVHEGRREEVEDLGELPVGDGAVSPEVRAYWGQMLDLAEDEIDAGNIPPEVLRWARALAEGKTVAEIAAEENVSASKIKMALKRARDYLGPRWKEIAGVGTTLMVIFLVLLLLPRRRPAPEDERPTRDISASTAPSSSAAETFDAGLVTADDLRASARNACNAHDFANCQWDLDRARQLDPDGEKRPEVIAMRKAIADSIRHMRLKP